MNEQIPAYIIYGQNEDARQAQVEQLQQALPNAVLVEPIFPSRQKVPFIKDLIGNAFKRSGYQLMPSELGVFMSHRSIWKKIVQEGRQDQHFLVLESDSKINAIHLIGNQVCAPVELPANSRHLDAYRANLVYSDLAYHCTAIGAGRARDGIESRRPHRTRLVRTGRCLGVLARAIVVLVCRSRRAAPPRVSRRMVQNLSRARAGGGDRQSHRRRHG